MKGGGKRIVEESMELFWAVFGALLSVILAIGWEHWRVRRRTRKVRGHWFSAWIPIDEKSMDWILEEVNIEVRSGKLTFDNSKNTIGIAWNGIGRLLSSNTVVGEWWYSDEKASYSGAFVLTIAHDGTSMCGYCMAADYPGTKIVGPVAYGRGMKDLEIAKSRIAQSKIKFPRV